MRCIPLGLCGVLSYLTLLLTGCSEEWRAVIYPERNSLLISRHVGTYSSLQDCRTAARAVLLEIGAQETGDYECGLNCRLSPGPSGPATDLHICQETLR